MHDGWRYSLEHTGFDHEGVEYGKKPERLQRFCGKELYYETLL